MTLQLSNVTQPVPTPENPMRIVICDLDRRLRNGALNVHPYTSVADFVASIQALIHYLQGSDVPCVLIFISLHFTPQQVEDFLRIHIHPNPTVNSYYLLFPDGEDYEQLWSNRYDARLKWCGSITNDFLRTVLSACFEGCYLKIRCYEKLLQRYKYQGVSSLVEQITLEIKTLVLLQREYYKEYERQLNS